MTTQPGQLLVPLSPDSVMPIDTGGPQAASVPVSLRKVTLNGATPVALVDVNITANSAIFFTLQTVGGTVGAVPAIQTITPGTGFTVAGTAGDLSTYNVARFG